MDDIPVQAAMHSLSPVLERAWREPFTVKSNFARDNAVDIAIAASLGLLTTQIRGSTFGTKWLITSQGLATLNECL